MTTTKPTLPYTEAESDMAHEAWNATCGPHSIAAACDVSLDIVHTALDGINYQGFMNPTQISSTLANLRKGFSIRRFQPLHDPTTLPEGITSPAILRIQFEGSWLGPKVPVGAAYKRTHYIALVDGHVLDPMTEPYRFAPLGLWLGFFPTIVLQEVKKSTGYHFTHAWLISK